MKYRDYLPWFMLSLHSLNDSWNRWIRNPFQIQSFFEYTIHPPLPPNLNPCAEIPIGKREICNIQIGRKIESPFSLTSFTERYEIGPWEAEHPMMRAIFQFAMEPQYLLGV